MTDEQAHEIIDDTIQAHWPNWEFRGQELVIWLKELRKFDYETAKQAINDLYLSWTKERYPKIAHIMAQIRLTAKQKYGTGRMTALFGIFTKEGKRKWCDFWGMANWPEQEIKSFAERVQTYANDTMEPGHYIHYYNTDEKEDTGYYGEEGRSIPVRRRQAKERAFADILSGPDTKTRRWLERYLDAQAKKQPITERDGKSDAPVRIGEVLDDDSDLPF